MTSPLRIPPKRTDDIDLSHIKLNPDGSRSADIAALKRRPEVQRRLNAIRKRRNARTTQDGNQ